MRLIEGGQQFEYRMIIKSRDRQKGRSPKIKHNIGRTKRLTRANEAIE